MILVFWPGDGIDIKDSLKGLADANDDYELEQRLSYPAHQSLPLLG